LKILKISIANMGDSALIMSTKKEHNKVVKYLIRQQKINIFYEDEEGFNAFDYAIAKFFKGI